MSFQNAFALRKTKPRKYVSRSPLKLASKELARELGPRYEIIDVRIGNQKMIYNIAQANWVSDGTIDETIGNSPAATKLEEENNVLRAKLDLLIDMLAEVTAEYEVRRTG